MAEKKKVKAEIILASVGKEEITDTDIVEVENFLNNHHVVILESGKNIGVRIHVKG